MKKTILIADDDADLARVLQKRLENQGYRVLTAPEGDSAVKMAVAERPDLIVMDVLMEPVSGGEAVKRLRANSATTDTPVIFLTGVMPGQSSGGQRDQQVNVDGVYYPAIGKPPEFDYFLNLIRQLIGRSESED